MSSTKSYTPLDEISQFPKKTFTISATGRAFVNNDPNSLTYGNIPLKQYLEENGETGAFINRHSEQIQGNFFIALTKSILKKTGSSCNTVAGDGTVIEAACSYYNR